MSESPCQLDRTDKPRTKTEAATQCVCILLVLALFTLLAVAAEIGCRIGKPFRKTKP